MIEAATTRIRQFGGDRDLAPLTKVPREVPSSRKQARIGLLEHCGTGNLGDDATVAAVLQQIRTRWPDASIVGLSLDPSDSQHRHGIRAFPIRQSVFAFEKDWSSNRSFPVPTTTLAGRLKQLLSGNRILFNIVKSLHATFVRKPASFVREVAFLGRSLVLAYHLDILIICGGGQLLDWGGPWAFPYTIFKWVFLARCTGAKCFFLNNGAGPLDHRLSRWFARRALSFGDYVSLRDRQSEAVVRGIGFRGNTQVVADCAWILRVPDCLRGAVGGPQRDQISVGIGPMAYCDPSRHWVKDVKRYRQLIDTLADFGSRLVARGHRLSLFSSDIWFDSRAIADLEAAVRERSGEAARQRVVREPVSSIDEFLRCLQRVDCYVTCRFHGVVLSHLLGVPVLAIAPHPKVTTLMEEAGLSDYCIDISQCRADALMHKFDRMVGNEKEIKVRTRRHVSSCQGALRRQFDHLFPATADSERCLGKRVR
jgi:polysaccharide pyruvyl transferase WcaK-like protein